MKVFFDQGTPVPLRRYLHPHAVDTAAERGWSELQNGDLLDHAETAGYQILITTDQNLKYQQDLSGRVIQVLVLLTTSWPRIRKRTEEILNAMEKMEAGGYTEVGF